ncbi:MAG: leucine-rich repeat protein, partial [Bacteroidaceae bacterium]|nr:leucine-rich repeat protein [Bacteroidaceae bacterium]
GATPVATEPYTLTTDEKGNAYLYGTFAEGATVSVKQGDVVLKDYTFTAEKNPNGTEHNKSYALDARPVIDGTLGGKAEATEDDITALVEQLKGYVDNGITTIIVPGSQPATIDMGLWINTAIGEAIYRLSEEESYDGKIDLILPDVTEIVDQEFDGAHALNSINLPKVTTVGDGAFYDCQYLEELTFGSVVTAINHNTRAEFHRVGEKVEGCDLVLNREQVNAEAAYQPNIETRTWWNTEWKSITLK